MVVLESKRRSNVEHETQQFVEARVSDLSGSEAAGSRCNKEAKLRFREWPKSERVLGRKQQRGEGRSVEGSKHRAY